MPEPQNGRPLAKTPWRIAVCGSASVGKTSLVEALAGTMGLPCLHEEMRAYLERTGTRLADLPPPEVEQILLELWQKRAAREQSTVAFVADNCALDFIAYGLHYRCLTDELVSTLLPQVLKLSAAYDAVFVLPWGVLPYIDDGVRNRNRHDQFSYQLNIEGLLRRYMQPGKLHFVPEQLTDMAARRQWILSLLQRQDNVGLDGKGMVYLVGAGPGDPRLLTLRAYELLHRADVVAHDLLISQAILSLVPARAELLAVGRRYGSEKKDYRLHPEVLERAQKGKMVVRLKCGDPFIFGRGGEEAEELTDAGIPFEVVPGISAALGAAAYGGIPLTHRCYASQLTLSTGHESGKRSHDGDAIKPNTEGTIVLYMAGRRLQANLDRLLQSGYAPETPAAYIANATTASQQVVVGTLKTLATKSGAIRPEAPAIVIAGQVVNLREKISWFERKRLHGCRILVARARSGVSKIASQLRELGAEVIEAPSISVAPLEDKSSLTDAIRGREYDAFIFGCAPAVEMAWPEIRMQDATQDVQWIAVGEQAGTALARVGAQNVIGCPGSCGEALSMVADHLRGRRALLITSNRGRPVLAAQLSAMGVKVSVATAYRVQYCFSALDRDPVFDLVVAPSSSAADLILSRVQTALRRTRFVTMGPFSAAAARRGGVLDVTEAPHDDVESLIGCVIEKLADRREILSAALAVEECGLARANG
jgi:uroporphyrinogen III methyltransferase / synthase